MQDAADNFQGISIFFASMVFLLRKSGRYFVDAQGGLVGCGGLSMHYF